MSAVDFDSFELKETPPRIEHTVEQAQIEGVDQAAYMEAAGPPRLMVQSGPGGAATVRWGPDFGAAGDLDQAAHAVLSAIAQRGNLTAAAEARLRALLLATELEGAGAVSLPLVKMAGVGITAAGNLVTARYLTSQILATRDAWAPNVAGCIDDVNKNGTDLEVDGGTATRKDIYMGWDLSGFPTGATVTAATLRLFFKTAATSAPAFDLRHLADAAEGWNETTLRCSTQPGGTTAAATGVLSNAGAGADKVVNFATNTTVRDRIATRMGVGNYTLAIHGRATQVGSAFYQSKDSAGVPGNASGPRLSLEFTVPT